MKKTSIKFLSTLTAIFFALAMFFSCEGPPGLDGVNGTNGLDANETCKQCHNPKVVDAVAVQYEFSKHSTGEAAQGEAGNAGCAPCHESEGFKYVCANNISSTFSIASGATTYSNNYSATASTAYGEIGCFTCHSKLHTTYGMSDFSPLTTTAPVAMTMWGGAKTIDLQQDSGISNLCVKCHQPRPFTRSNGDKNVIDYSALVSSPNTIFFDGNNPSSTANINTIKLGYRTHTHYGTAGAIFAGKGGIEFGTGYGNSWHTTGATCQDCHMAPMSGKAGGHTFSALGNFNGCNVSGCHASSPISSSTADAHWKQTRDATKAKLETLAGLLNYNGVEIMNRNGDATSNLWYGLTTNNYDGYLNIYDPVNNPNGSTYNTGGMFKNPTTTGWSAAQIATNNTLPAIVITNEQMGAIINFQLCLRDYSMGVHNKNYTFTLLDNTIAALQTP